MKNKIVKLAQTISLLALAGFGSGAYADSITINFDNESIGGSGAASFQIGNWVFEDPNATIAISAGSCGSDEDNAPEECINLSVGDSFTLRHVDNILFTLDSFWVNFNGADLGLNFATQAVQGSNEEYYACNVGVTIEDCVGYTLGALDSIFFDSQGERGNMRLDDFSLSYNNGNGVSVPEPGTVGLLGLGLLGLAARRRNKA